MRAHVACNTLKLQQPRLHARAYAEQPQFLQKMLPKYSAKSSSHLLLLLLRCRGPVPSVHAEARHNSPFLHLLLLLPHVNNLVALTYDVVDKPDGHGGGVCNGRHALGDGHVHGTLQAKHSLQQSDSIGVSASSDAWTAMHELAPHLMSTV
jgi:hypothetical protein